MRQSKIGWPQSRSRQVADGGQLYIVVSEAGSLNKITLFCEYVRMRDHLRGHMVAGHGLAAVVWGQFCLYGQNWKNAVGQVCRTSPKILSGRGRVLLSAFDFVNNALLSVAKNYLNG
jgi:hypothetical protein